MDDKRPIDKKRYTDAMLGGGAARTIAVPVWAADMPTAAQRQTRRTTRLQILPPSPTPAQREAARLADIAKRDEQMARLIVTQKAARVASYPQELKDAVESTTKFMLDNPLMLRQTTSVMNPRRTEINLNDPHGRAEIEEVRKRIASRMGKYTDRAEYLARK